MAVAVPIFLDIDSGRLRKSATDDTEVSLRAVALGDVVELGLRLVQSDANVTATVLGSGESAADVVTSLRDALHGTDLLAEATSYTLAGGVATIVLALTGAFFADLFPADEPPGERLLWLEFSYRSADGSRSDSWRVRLPVERRLSTAS